MTESSNREAPTGPPSPRGNHWAQQLEAERQRVAELVEALRVTRSSLAHLESQLSDERVTASELLHELDAEHVIETANVARLKGTASPLGQAEARELARRVAMAENLVRALDSANQLVSPLVAGLASLDYADAHRGLQSVR